ncbi:3-phosphoshikimate 1-carboxyvinyltransferase [Mesobacillus campisalis]|uniref:3-phosphoshikimate 1-carboxyvinyltransferase n=1 Tax=Mesobacillus campisalis TaxID=1408103 RepID=A0A0M2SX98_9BACI|nr:3-phosphoshikimate 1-carboxyvinyltransferase [Mesobacillus campisalis]KKK37602.1 3-phosphoshikimate 1-carboxyvinyltransferase [Mesobacillus campisalis]
MKATKLNSNRVSLQGTIQVPGDKSISHRAVMFGSVAQGTTTVENFLPGEDCLSTIACFQKLGVSIEQEGSSVTIEGVGFEGLQEPMEVLDVGNSGTTIRLLMGILAGRPFHAVFTGDESIAKRPMTRVTVPLAQMGARISGRKDGEFTPISISGGGLKGIHYPLPVASAQVKSSILLAGLQAEGTTTVVEPEKTRDHTERMIKMFGGSVSSEGNEISVQGGQKLAAARVMVPGDISSAAFFLAAGAIVPGSRIKLLNVGLNPTRTGILDALQEMGADIEVLPYETENAEPAGDIIVQTSDLKGITIEGELIPRLIDEIPIIALLATQAEGRTLIKDAAELKVKETNRIDTVVKELSKMGAEIEATEDGMVIHGKTSLRGSTVSSHGDHRIGMMLAVAALLARGEDSYLENSEAIAVSYPAFFEHLESLF